MPMQTIVLDEQPLHGAYLNSVGGCDRAGIRRIPPGPLPLLFEQGRARVALPFDWKQAMSTFTKRMNQTSNGQSPFLFCGSLRAHVISAAFVQLKCRLSMNIWLNLAPDKCSACQACAILLAAAGTKYAAFATSSISIKFSADH